MNRWGSVLTVVLLALGCSNINPDDVLPEGMCFEAACYSERELCLSLAFSWCFDEADVDSVFDCLQNDILVCNVQFYSCKVRTAEPCFR